MSGNENKIDIVIKLIKLWTTVTLTLNTEIQSFHKTLQFMVMYNQVKKKIKKIVWYHTIRLSFSVNTQGS